MRAAADRTDRCACGTPLEHAATGRPRRHCSPACKMRAVRRRQKLAALTALRLAAATYVSSCKVENE